MKSKYRIIVDSTTTATTTTTTTTKTSPNSTTVQQPQQVELSLILSLLEQVFICSTDDLQMCQTYANNIDKFFDTLLALSDENTDIMLAHELRSQKDCSFFQSLSKNFNFKTVRFFFFWLGCFVLFCSPIFLFLELMNNNNILLLILETRIYYV